MSINDMIRNIMSNKYFVLILLIGFVAGLVWCGMCKEKANVGNESFTEEVDEDLFDEPCSQSLPCVLKPGMPNKTGDMFSGSLSGMFDDSVGADKFGPSSSDADAKAWLESIPRNPNGVPLHNKTLSDFYSDNLRGSNQADPTIKGINDTLDGDNVNSSYTLGVSLDEQEAKDLGVIHKTHALTSDDLLPKEKKDWFSTPDVGISVKDANLLATAEFRIGSDTQGNYRKGMTLDPRGSIPVPKINVCPWNQSSRDPDNTLGWCSV